MDITKLTDVEIIHICAKAAGVEVIPIDKNGVTTDKDPIGFYLAKNVFVDYDPLLYKGQTMDLLFHLMKGGWCISMELDDRLEVYRPGRSVFSANHINDGTSFLRAICLCVVKIYMDAGR